MQIKLTRREKYAGTVALLMFLVMYASFGKLIGSMLTGLMIGLYIYLDSENSENSEI